MRIIILFPSFQPGSSRKSPRSGQVRRGRALNDISRRHLGSFACLRVGIVVRATTLGDDDYRFISYALSADNDEGDDDNEDPEGRRDDNDAATDGSFDECKGGIGA